MKTQHQEGMKTRRLFHGAVLLAGVLLAAACTTERYTAEVPGDGGSLHFRAEVTAAPVATRSLALSETNTDSILTKWQEGEEVALVYTAANGTACNVTTTVTAVKLNGSAVIEGTLETVPAAGAAVTVIYPASAADGTTGNVRADVLAEQDGTLATISEKFDVATATTTLAGPAADGSVSFAAPLTLTHRNAICLLKMLDLEGSPLTATKLVVSDASDNVITTVTLPAEGVTECYVALPATTAENHNFVATVGSDEYAISGTGNLLAGCYYQDEMLMKLVPDVIVKETFTVNGVSFEMVQIKSGIFTVGAEFSDIDDPFYSDLVDDPTTGTYGILHQVQLSTYSIQTTEVTFALWEAVMGSKPTTTLRVSKNGELCNGDDYPVVNISYDEAKEFAEKLTDLLSAQLGGRKFHLPTEAQWEVAARGGKYNRGYQFAGSATLDDVGWYDKNCGMWKPYSGAARNEEVYPIHPVAQKTPNDLGLYDMSGNVSEMVYDLWVPELGFEWDDWYQEEYGDPIYDITQIIVDPKGPDKFPDNRKDFLLDPDEAEEDNVRIQRGGAAYQDEGECTVFRRDYYYGNDVKNDSFGFRLALSKVFN